MAGYTGELARPFKEVLAWLDARIAEPPKNFVLVAMAEEGVPPELLEHELDHAITVFELYQDAVNDMFREGYSIEGLVSPARGRHFDVNFLSEKYPGLLAQGATLEAHRATPAEVYDDLAFLAELSREAAHRLDIDMAGVEPTDVPAFGMDEDEIAEVLAPKYTVGARTAFMLLQGVIDALKVSHGKDPSPAGGGPDTSGTRQAPIPKI